MMKDLQSISAIIILVSLLVFTFMDIVFREIKKRYVLLMYIPSLEIVISQNMLNKIWLSVLVFFLPSIIFYIVAVILNDEFIGSIDIIIVSLFSFWFSHNYVVFILIFCLLQVALYCTRMNLYIAKLTDISGTNHKKFPVLFSYTVTFIVTYNIIGSNIMSNIFP